MPSKKVSISEERKSRIVFEIQTSNRSIGRTSLVSLCAAIVPRGSQSSRRGGRGSSVSGGLANSKPRKWQRPQEIECKLLASGETKLWENDTRRRGVGDMWNFGSGPTQVEGDLADFHNSRVRTPEQ